VPNFRIEEDNILANLLIDHISHQYLFQNEPKEFDQHGLSFFENENSEFQNF
jgi:hypothetical protein